MRAPLLQHVQKKRFPVTTDQLHKLIDSKHHTLLDDMGGISGLCQLLEVDPTLGLSPDESFDPCYGIAESHKQESFADRKAIFGKNEIPAAPPKTFLSLIWAAYNDQTLSKLTIFGDIFPYLTPYPCTVMLTVAAIVSLVVGVWEDNSESHPPDEPKVGW
jgi:Ca2+-transporting ATPase